MVEVEELRFVKHVGILDLYLVKHVLGVVKYTSSVILRKDTMKVNMNMAFIDALNAMKMDLYDVQCVVIKYMLLEQDFSIFGFFISFLSRLLYISGLSLQY